MTTAIILRNRQLKDLEAKVSQKSTKKTFKVSSMVSKSLRKKVVKRKRQALCKWSNQRLRKSDDKFVEIQF